MAYLCLCAGLIKQQYVSVVVVVIVLVSVVVLGLMIGKGTGVATETAFWDCILANVSN